MSRLKKHVSRIWKKKEASTVQLSDEAALQVANALTQYIPGNHPSIIEWLKSSEVSDNHIGYGNVGIQEVPLKRPRQQSEEQFRRSWNSQRLDVEIPEALIDIKFDQLRTVDILAPAEFRDRNDSGLSLFEDFTRPPSAARKHPAEATDRNGVGIWELSDQWETLEGRLRDLVEEHAASCRKCWHECWE
jgi:hypothetical protein